MRLGVLMPTLVKMPKWGLTMKVGKVTEWLHREGDAIAEGEPLLVVETDKATNDVPAPAAGVLRKIVADVEAEVPVSNPLAVIAAPNESLTDTDLATFLAQATEAVAAGGTATATAARVSREARAATPSEEGRVNASPAARKRAQELGVDLSTVLATGPGGRITSDDVERAGAATTAREDIVTLPDGRRIFYVLAGPANASTRLVFLHGLGGTQSTWQMVLPQLAEHFRVCALDLPGHGQSDKPAPAQTDYSLGSLAAAVAQAMETLGLAPAVLIGHSLGGAVALTLALEHPERVRAVVLVDSLGLGIEINPELLGHIEAQPSQEEARKLLELFFHDKRHVLDSGVDDLYHQQQSPGTHEAVRAIASGTMNRSGQTTHLPERLGDVSAPALVLWGADDQVIPARHAASASEQLHDAQMKIFASAGHVPQIEQAEQFTQALEDFLRAQQP